MAISDEQRHIFAVIQSAVLRAKKAAAAYGPDAGGHLTAKQKDAVNSADRGLQVVLDGLSAAFK